MKKKLLFEINRYRQLMGTILLTEGGKVLDEFLPLTPRTVDNLTRSGLDFANDLTKLSDEFANIGVRTWDDLSNIVAKNQGLSSDEITDQMIRNYIKSNEKLYTSILTNASEISAKQVDTLLKNANLTQIFSKNPNQLESHKVYLSTAPSVRNIDTLINGLSDSIDEIEKIIDDIQTGKIPGFTVVPKELEDLYDDLLSKKAEADEFKNRQNNTNTTTLNSSDPQDYLKGLSEEQLVLRLNNVGKITSRGWYDFGTGYVAEEMSGWKFHVFGETLEDSVFLSEKLKPIVEKYGTMAKVGGPTQVKLETMKPGTDQYGKQGATIYIPNSVINSGRQQEMLSNIQNAIAGYKKGGTISGDQAITPTIHYRYELLGPIPKTGIDYNTYDAMYNKNSGGSYKPDDVEDLFTTK